MCGPECAGIQKASANVSGTANTKISKMSFAPTRYRDGGTRGGADCFKWEDVKNDKYRENYLGNSLKASVGRWQKGRDLTWYAKGSSAAAGSSSSNHHLDAARAELERAKARDKRLMNQALGIEVSEDEDDDHDQRLNPYEVSSLLKRKSMETEATYVERVEGLGTTSVPTRRVAEHIPKKTLAQQYLEQKQTVERSAKELYRIGGDNEESDDSTKASRKKARKEKKKEKKRRKKEAKRSKRRRRSRS